MYLITLGSLTTISCKVSIISGEHCYPVPNIKSIYFLFLDSKSFQLDKQILIRRNFNVSVLNLCL